MTESHPEHEAAATVSVDSERDPEPGSTTPSEDHRITSESEVEAATENASDAAAVPDQDGDELPDISDLFDTEQQPPATGEGPAPDQAVDDNDPALTIDHTAPDAGGPGTAEVSVDEIAPPTPPVRPDDPAPSPAANRTTPDLPTGDPAADTSPPSTADPGPGTTAAPPDPNADSTIVLPVVSAEVTAPVPTDQSDSIDAPDVSTEVSAPVPTDQSDSVDTPDVSTEVGDQTGSIDATELMPAVVVPPPTDAAPTVVVDPTPSPAVAAATAAPVTPMVTILTPPKKSRRLGLLTITAVVGALAVLIGAWLFDSVRTEGEVIRGTVLGTTPIGGLDNEGLDNVISGLNGDLGNTDLVLQVGDTTLTSDPVTFGAGLDAEALKAEALEARRGGSLLLQPYRWITTFFTEEVLEPTYVVDEQTAAGAAEELIATSLAQPEEPGLELRSGEFQAFDGVEGVRFDSEEIVAALPVKLEQAAPYELTLNPLASTPRLSDAAIFALADEVNEATAGDVIVRVLDQTADLATSDLRSWVEFETVDDEPSWRINGDAALDDLRPLFPTLGSEDQQARFSIVDDAPIIIPAAETVVCCTDSSIVAIRERLLEPPPPPPTNDTEDGAQDAADDNGETEEPKRIIIIEPEVVGSDEGVAELESLGIVEEVSSFTTNHACCQNRVSNIQRFADLVRGTIIRPGEDLSLNAHVGRRTTEKGFVADGAIINGILEPQVGGGISQFATTFFNAAFYAGIDFNTYQSHSLYISRYPRGREATISWQQPDLSVKNTTEYGILVWPTYDATSITVTFYSTKHIDVEDLPLLRSSRGECSVYTTPRIRTYPDGTQLEDSVFALYRPGEGLDCNGNSTVPEEEPAGPTIAPEPEEEPVPVTQPGPDPEPDPSPSTTVPTTTSTTQPEPPPGPGPTIPDTP